jgi:hypothetical protein
MSPSLTVTRASIETISSFVALSKSAGTTASGFGEATPSFATTSLSTAIAETTPLRPAPLVRH